MVLTKRGYMDAHLIELRSLGGISGSPVFFATEPYWINNGNVHSASSQQIQKTAYLLGLVHGHIVLRNENDIARDGPSSGSEAPTPDELNAGIAVVVPLDKIMETINRADLVSEREAIVKTNKYLA
jgi:hypothetical protein